MTLVGGKPVWVYPGLCNKGSWANCKTGTNLAIATPANASDPLYTYWEKVSARVPCWCMGAWAHGRIR